VDNSVSPVLVLLLVLFFLALLLAPLVLFFIYVGYQNWKRNDIRKKILSANSASVEKIPVRYASEQRFNSLFKIFPWDTAGVIFNSPGTASFLGERMSGEQVCISFRPEEATWVGKAPWPNGAVSWFRVDTDGAKHYFSSETGFFIIGSSKSTKGILAQVGGKAEVRG
jgi:hypothetical protein